LEVQGTKSFDETKLPKAEEAARPWEVFKLSSVGGMGQMPAETFKTLASSPETAQNAALVVERKLGDCCTKMLIDTEVPVKHLTQPVQPAQPIVAGETLDLLGQDKLQLQVGDLHIQFPVFIARELTQECLLGADFRKHDNCVIEMRELTLVVEGKQVMCQFPKLMLVCHVCSCRSNPD